MTAKARSPLATASAMWLAVLIAVGATALRLSLTKFPVLVHPDEPIVASLTERSVRTGQLSADWDGFPGQNWSRPTYQFSPYSLTQELVTGAVHRLVGWPNDLAGHIHCVRWTSCCWGGVAVLLVYLAARTYYGNRAGFLAEATLAVCLVSVQDSVYARVDAFVGFLVGLTFFLTIKAQRAQNGSAWLMLASVCAGVTVACKYNSAPVLVFPCLVPLLWHRQGSLSRRRAATLALICFSGATAGLVLATPEMLWKPWPFLAGIRYEAQHYRDGHPPNQAYGWGDNNLFYWISYVARLGYGWLPMIAVLAFGARTMVKRCLREMVLATFLLLAAGVLLASRVRFERNLEICLGPLTVASAAGAFALLEYISGWLGRRTARSLAAAFLILWFAQPLLVLRDFRIALGYWYPQRQWLVSVLRTDRTLYVSCMTDHPNAAAHAYHQIVLQDYGDPFSEKSLREWMAFFGDPPFLELRSPWSRRGYPFSTVDVYHGPSRIRVLLPSVRGGVGLLRPQEPQRASVLP